MQRSGDPPVDLSTLVRFTRRMGDQPLRMIAELTCEPGYNKLFNADRRGENRLMTLRTMNVERLSGGRAGRNNGDTGR
jgi:hypothetical protein